MTLPQLAPNSVAPGRRKARLVALAATLLLGTIGGVLALADPGASASATSGGWTTNGAASPTSPRRGTTVSLSATVSSNTSRTGLVDLEVFNASGGRVYQRAWDAQGFTANQARTFTTSIAIPSSQALGIYTVRIGIYTPGWGAIQHWNSNAAIFTVTAASTTSTSLTTPTTIPTTPAPTTSPTTTAPPAGGKFTTLPVGAALPSDDTCAARVRRTSEVRPANAAANQTPGHGAPANPPSPLYNRVSGNFVGTTDEIIQWASCKWGIDEDVARAQTAIESWWYQSVVGDNGESFGLMQVRQPYWGWAFNNGNGDARTSSAYNLDAALAARRNCFEGNETWLGGSYAKGDLWGCVGLWFSGRWKDAAANQYIANVQSYLNQRIWETPNFRAG